MAFSIVKMRMHGGSEVRGDQLWHQAMVWGGSGGASEVRLQAGC